MTRRLRSLPLPVLIVAALFASAPLHAQEADDGQLTLERIFDSDEFKGEPFGPVRWLDRGSAYTTVEPPPSVEGGSDIVRYDARTGKREVLVPASDLIPAGASESLEVEEYSWSEDGEKLLIFTNSQRVWRTNTRGDYWVLDLQKETLEQLGGDAAPSTLMFAKFSPDGTRVGYVRENNVYVEDLATGEIQPLTTDGSRTIINGTFDWVYEEELGLKDGWRWSPDGERIAYWQLDASGVRDFLLINNTDSLYSFTIPVQYPKAGTTNSAGRVGAVAAAGGPTQWLDVPGDPRDNYIARMEWAANSGEVVIQHLNRLQNTLEIMLGDVQTGNVHTIHTERDSAWVDLRVNVLQWLGGGREFVWLSERDGWRHAYVISRDGKEARLVTRGEFDVIDVARIDEAGSWLYYLASPDDPKRQYLYRSRLDGTGDPERLTPAHLAGVNAYDVSTDAEWAIHRRSAFDSAPVADLVHLPDHAAVRALVENVAKRARIASLDRGPVEFFRVDIGDGVMLDGWMMQPPDFDPEKRYPVLFYVYGEPWGQTVLDEWAGDTYLWHLLLTQQGYLVVSVDPRGTPSPRGREWRKVIYQKIGRLTSADLAGAARVIADWPYVDASRIGIWGWSGGGSQSLNAIFRYPNLFGTAIAVAPVPDIRLYDTIYQERYVGLPQESSEVYRESSPITYADRLEGNLLVIHGTGDDNVHFQGTERLINALIAANKPFTMMAYPNRTHGISEGENTTLHLYGLMTRFLLSNLKPGPAPDDGPTALREDARHARPAGARP